jgi:hypothetical protein
VTSTLGRVRAGVAQLGDAEWLKSWVPMGERGCRGYAAACQCPTCQRHDAPPEPLSEDFRAEVLDLVRGAEPSPPTRCHGYSNGCACPTCRGKAERQEQRRNLRRLERQGLIEREPEDSSEEFRKLMQSNRGIG